VFAREPYRNISVAADAYIDLRGFRLVVVAERFVCSDFIRAAVRGGLARVSAQLENMGGLAQPGADIRLGLEAAGQLVEPVHLLGADRGEELRADGLRGASGTKMGNDRILSNHRWRFSGDTRSLPHRTRSGSKDHGRRAPATGIHKMEDRRAALPWLGDSFAVYRTRGGVRGKRDFRFPYLFAIA
jgi:hypothetical protein